MSVFGVYGTSHAAQVIYYGLHAIQHRGQEGAGIVTFNGNGEGHRLSGKGLISEIFNKDNLATLTGNMGLGNVRYTSSGKGLRASGNASLNDVQPLYFRHRTGDFAVACDGSLVNSAQITDYLENKGNLLQTGNESELLAHLIKKDGNEPRIFTIIDALNMMEGGFAFLIMTKNRIYACRDKYGIKPLAIGKLGDAWVVSSESCSFDLAGAEFVRDVEPGEIVTIDEKGLRSRKYSQFHRRKMCAMEYIYLARPDSDIDGCNVHAFRKEAGRRLFRECPADADIVGSADTQGRFRRRGNLTVKQEKSGNEEVVGISKRQCARAGLLHSAAGKTAGKRQGRAVRNRHDKRVVAVVAHGVRPVASPLLQLDDQP